MEEKQKKTKRIYIILIVVIVPMILCCLLISWSYAKSQTPESKATRNAEMTLTAYISPTITLTPLSSRTNPPSRTPTFASTATLNEIQRLSATATFTPTETSTFTISPTYTSTPTKTITLIPTKDLAVEPPDFQYRCEINEIREVCVSSFEYRKHIGYSSVPAGMRYIVFYLQVENNSISNDISVNTNHVSIVMKNNSVYGHSFETYSFANSLPPVQLGYGETAGGAIVFEVPDDIEPYKVIYRGLMEDKIEIFLIKQN